MEGGYLTATAEGYDIPRIVPESETDVLRIIIDTENFIKEEIQVMEDGKYRDYRPETFIFDSATALETLLMGAPSRKDDNKNVVRPGSGIMSIDRNRQNERPSIEDYGDLSGKMGGFFNAVRAMPFHTIVNAHALVGEEQADSRRSLRDKSAAPSRNVGLPALTGRMKYTADNLCDFFLYCESKRKGKEVEYYAHTIPSGLWHAKSRLAGIIPVVLIDPSYDEIIKYYNKAIGVE